MKQAPFTARELAIALLVLKGEMDINSLNPRQREVVAAAMENV